MKKTFTILFAVGMVLSAAAQPNYKTKQAHDNNKNDYSTQYAAAPGFSFAKKEKERQLREIDNRFDRKIYLVKQDRRMGWRQQSAQVQMLEKQRSIEIRQVLNVYEKNSQRYANDRYSKNNTRRY
ncbi:MAG: hypothetical protein ABIQ88_22185 [Chitinophagaceae bacterium]